MKPFLVILSAPSGGGKTTVAHALVDARDDLAFSVSATTRPPRAGEEDGIDYHFLTREAFMERVDRGDFLEWAEYSGNLYGTLRSEVDAMIAAGSHVLLDIEIQGARQVRERSDNVVSIFILPPSVEVLLQRLRDRKSETSGAMRERLHRSVEEVAVAQQYDYVVINNTVEASVQAVTEIIHAEARRPGRDPALVALAEQIREGMAREERAVTDNT